MSATLKIVAIAETARAVAGLNKLDTTTGKAASGVSRAGSKMGGMAKAAGALAGAAALGGVVTVLKTGITEQKDYLSGQAQLAAGIKSTGGAANVSVGHLEKLAGSVQNYSGQTDDSIVASEKLLLTFTNVTNAGGKAGGMFDQATKATADMAAKMGGDASKYAVQLGKALNDPTKGISALTRVGVSFTSAQKKSITTMQKSGDTLGAQKIIMGELKKEFGGAAKAAGNTLPGQLERGKRAFEDMAQGVGAAALPLLVQLAQSVLPIVGVAIRALTPIITSLVKVIGPVLTAVVKALMPVIKQLAPLIGSILVTAVRALSPILAAIAPLFTSIVKIAGALLMPVLRALVPVFKPIAAAINILMQALLPLVPIIAEFATIVGQVLAQALKAIAPLLPTMAKLITAVLTAITPLLPIINLAARLIGAVLVAAIKVLVPIINLVMRAETAWYRSMASVIAGIVRVVSGGIRTVARWFGTVKGAISRAVSGVFAAVTGPFKSAWSWISTNAHRMWSWASGVAAAIGRGLSGVFKAIIGPFKSAWDWISLHVIDPIKSAWNGVAKAINSIHFSVTVPSNVITRATHLAGKGFTFDPPNVPTLASGGVVSQATLALVGEGRGREIVAPEAMLRQIMRDEAGGTTINYEITINGAVDTVGVAKQLKAILRADERRRHGTVHVGAA